MKFTDIVRDHYRGPAYGQEFTTWYTKVQHGFSTAQVPESAQVDHLVAVLDSPAQELAFSFIKKYNAEHPTEGLRGQQLVQYHEDKLAALVAHLQSKSSVVHCKQLQWRNRMLLGPQLSAFDHAAMKFFTNWDGGVY